MSLRNWYFGSVYCVINNVLAYLTVAASVLTLMAITLDRFGSVHSIHIKYKETDCASIFRYRAILYPLRPKLSRCYIFSAIGCIWAFSFLLALPALLYSTTFTIRYEHA